MNELEQDLYRKIIKRGLEQLFLSAVAARGDEEIPPLHMFDEEYILTDALIRALKAYTEANN